MAIPYFSISCKESWKNASSDNALNYNPQHYGRLRQDDPEHAGSYYLNLPTPQTYKYLIDNSELEIFTKI